MKRTFTPLLSLFACLFLLTGAMTRPAFSAETTTVGGACVTGRSAADWDTIFQCVSSVWKRAAYWLGSSSDSCDSSHAGIIQWSGTAFQGCDGTSWKTLGGTACDESLRTTTLLLHMDGSNGGTTFTDSSLYANTITNTGVTTSTAQSKFGTTSSYFNGSSTLSAPDSDNFNFSGDFTIDGWFYFNSVASDYGLVSQWSAGSGNDSFYFIFYSGSIGFFYSSNGTTQIRDSFGWAPSVGVWYHLAVVRSGTSLKLYVNGTQTGSSFSISGSLYNSANSIYVGSYSNSFHFFNGYIDELRISKGIARWTANFTPPTTAYTGRPCLLN